MKQSQTEMKQSQTEMKQNQTEMKQSQTDLKQSQTEMKQNQTEMKQNQTEIKQKLFKKTFSVRIWVKNFLKKLFLTRYEIKHERFITNLTWFETKTF